MIKLSSKMIVLAGIFFALAHSGYASDRVSVCVSILPQKYFVEQIGGDRVAVQVMVAPGSSPATYEPKPRQMTKLLTTRIYFAIGVPYENAWLGKISAVNPEMTVVHTEQGIERIPLSDPHRHEDEGAHSELDEHPSQGHGDEDPHDDGLDPHIWLSPPLVKRQALTILTALQDMDPGNKEWYAANYRDFISQIDRLDVRLKEIFGKGPGIRFMVFHPSWGYFARAYGLEQIAIEIDGKDPKPAQLKSLIEEARHEEIRVIFVQPQFSSRSAELVAREINGRVAVADPLAEDWEDNLLKVAENIRAAYK